ncbi:MAG TPA: hypothetical protein VLG66_03375 [Alphaproteobacteria bacterium]|nr:hypothetical protein [Alphaproteobacteria bacterium]
MIDGRPTIALLVFALGLLAANASAQTPPGQPINPPVAANRPGESDAALCARTAREGNFKACTRAVTDNPDDLDSRRNLAAAYLAVNDLENTDRVHREIIALIPDDPHAYYDYAAALSTFFEYKLAMEPIRAALRLAPDDLPTLRLAAIIFEQAKSYRDAFAAAHAGAEHGEVLLMFDTAVYYQRGLGTPVDPTAARLWFERAANAGHVAAMEILGKIYREGRDGAPVDAARAEYWEKRAADEGIPPNPPAERTY